MTTIDDQNGHQVDGRMLAILDFCLDGWIAHFAGHQRLAVFLHGFELRPLRWMRTQ